MKRPKKIALAVLLMLSLLSVVAWWLYRDYQDTQTALKLTQFCPRISELLGSPFQIARGCRGSAGEHCVELIGSRGRGEYHFSAGTRADGQHDLLMMSFVAGAERIDVLTCANDFVRKQMEVRDEIETTKVSCVAGNAEICDHIADLLSDGKWLAPDPAMAAQYRHKAMQIREERAAPK